MKKSDSTDGPPASELIDKRIAELGSVIGASNKEIKH